jgi:hypothetical protein
MALGALALNMTAGQQPNREIIALFLPAQLALGLALLMPMPRRETPAPVRKE